MKKPSRKLLKISIFLILILGAFILPYTFLYQGVKIQSFQIGGIEFQGFYLRLDKKLILEIHSLNLSNLNYTQNDNLDIKNQIKYAKNIHLLLQYFQKIQIHQITLDDYNASLNYDGEHFTINLPWLYTKLNLKEKSSKIFIDLQDLYLKNQGLYYQGSGQYDLTKQTLNLTGKLDFLDLQTYKSFAQLQFTLNGNPNNLTLKGSSNTFENIKFLRPLLPSFKNKFVESWIFDNYEIRSAKIDDFSISIPLKSKNILQDSLKTLYVSGVVKDAKVTFHQDLPQITSPSVKISFYKDTLEFQPQSPIYQKHFLQGSYAKIESLLHNPNLKIFIQTNSLLDEDITTLLNAYSIHLPLQIPNAKIQTNLYLGIDLKTHSITHKGFFSTQNAEVLLDSIPFSASEIQVNMDNQKIEVKSKESRFQEILNADLDFILDTDKQTISGDMDIHSLEILGDSQKIISIQNHLFPFAINFQEKDFLLEIPPLDFSIIANKNYTFKLKNLHSLTPFSDILKSLKVTGGFADISTQDFKSFSGNLSIQSQQNILLDKATNEPIRSFQLTLNSTPQETILQSSDEKIFFESQKDKKTLAFKNITIFLDSSQVASKPSLNTPLSIQGTQSNLLYEKYLILGDSFSLWLVDDELKATLTHKNGKADIYKKGDFLTIDAREFGDTFLNALARKDVFSNGRFSINANTNEKGVLIGNFKLLGTSINQLNILQNLMAFIDTIPSLLSFKMPGFNNQGYYLDEGEVVFGFNKDFLAIESLDFNGSSIDIKGKGIIDIKEQNIDFYAQLITAKSFSGIINKIPLVNYILLGKEGTISTNFSIKGSLENPLITTQTAQDLLLSPFNILKRVIISPFEIFN